MVMVSRNAFKRSSDTWSSDVSNIIPPWCSSVAFLLSCDTQKKHFITYLSKSETLSIQKSIAVEECSNRMSALTLELHRAERALRNTLRVRKTMFTQNIIKEPALQYISGGKVVQGSATTEWGGSVALWGAVRLWRASPPPDTVLSVRPPAPADCWPFRGSYGEMIIQLPRSYLVERVSLEHVRPDTAHSAPKHFTLHGILDNGTWVKSVDAQYVRDKPPKQYFVLCTKSVPLQRLVFRVLSNHGNTRYTCVYRVHLYTKLTQN